MMTDLTQILSKIEGGDPTAAEKLLPLVYDELRKLAAAKLNHDRSAKSIQPTLLVHEAYLRLVEQESDPEWSNRGHFFAAAAEAMRRILVEHARRKQSQKRGGGWQRLPLDHVEPEVQPLQVDLLDLDQALAKLEQEWPVHAKLVKLRFFAGLTIAESAKAMGISPATVERHWAFAKAWLFAQLESQK